MNNLLSSLAVFKELYDQKKDVYDILRSFIVKIIQDEGLYVFTVPEITSKLKANYEFIIPDAIIKTALKRLPLNSSSGKYTVGQNITNCDENLSNALRSASRNTEKLLSNLYRYIEDRLKRTIDESERKTIKEDFFKYLLDQYSSKNYTKYISAYLISEKDQSLLEALNIIRQGLILYSGLNYEDISNLGNWTSKLTIYMDTEIIFHMAGYNGVVYKKYFDDFYKYVKEINNKSRTKLISLKYFKEILNEINVFFDKAKNIVEGRTPIYPRNTAMATITKGCKRESDLQEKRADLFTLLSNNSIEMDDSDYYENQQKYKHNILDKEIIDEMNSELGHDVYNDAKLLNYINYKRGFKEFDNFSHVNYIFLTGNYDVINIAWHPKIKNERIVPLATTLDWITNKFWFKLQKGFGQENIPLNVDIIIKSKTTLSSIISDSINLKFLEMSKDAKEGKLTEQIAKGRLLQLRNSSRKPEDIEKDDLDGIMSFLSEDSISKYVKEQELEAAKAIENEEKANQLQQQLEVSKAEFSNVITRSFEEQIKQKNETLKAKTQNKEVMDNLYKRIKKNTKMKSKLFLGVIFLLYVLLIGWSYIFLNKIQDRQLTIISTIISLVLATLPPLLFVCFQRKFVFKRILADISEIIKRQEERKFSFDTALYVQLDNDIKILTEEIIVLKSNRNASSDV